jgi:hypothetical protein
MASSNKSIANKAYAKAEADFTTWLMMAKLGGFDDLPPNAQGFLTSYRERLQTMHETQSTGLAIREVYNAYYSEMGGSGDAPEPQPRKPPEAKLNGKGRPNPVQPVRPPARRWIKPMSRQTLRALLIFAGLVALIALYRFLVK